VINNKYINFKHMLAVIKTGGKQFVVSKGDKIRIEKLLGEEGSTVTFDAVLLKADEKGSKVEVGTPTVTGAVEGKILKQARSRKVEVVKYKPKTRYKTVNGHRQYFTEVEITKI